MIEGSGHGDNTYTGVWQNEGGGVYGSESCTISISGSSFISNIAEVKGKGTRQMTTLLLGC